METIERKTEAQTPTPGPDRRRGLLVAAAALVVAIIAVGVVITVAGGDNEPDVAGGPVAAEDARFEGVFRDDGAVLEASDLVTAGLVQLTLINESTREASLVGFRFANEEVMRDELATLGVGENQARQGQEASQGLVTFTVAVPAGTERTESISLTNGWYLMDWLTEDQFGIPDHTWRVGTIEVTDNGTGDLAPISSAADIVGTYFRRGPGAPTFLLFQEDGTIHNSPDKNQIVDNPVTIHQTRFEGTRLFITTEGAMCDQPDPGGSYEVHVLESGSLQFVAVSEDTCAIRSIILQGFGNNDTEFEPVP